MTFNLLATSCFLILHASHDVIQMSIFIAINVKLKKRKHISTKSVSPRLYLQQYHTQNIIFFVFLIHIFHDNLCTGKWQIISYNLMFDMHSLKYCPYNFVFRQNNGRRLKISENLKIAKSRSQSLKHNTTSTGKYLD